jgi:hypothetical protein
MRGNRVAMMPELYGAARAWASVKMPIAARRLTAALRHEAMPLGSQVTLQAIRINIKEWRRKTDYNERTERKAL